MRILLGRTLVGAALLAMAAIPSGALAKNKHQHGKRHGHHKPAKLQKFGNDQPGTPNQSNAGTVASFSNGTLTINLAGGGTVSGKVTNATEIECQSAQAAHEDFKAVTGSEDEHGQQPPSTNPTPPTGHEPGDNEHGDQQHGNGAHGDDDGQNENENEVENENCGTAALTPGAVVREATLRADSSGMTFTQIELIK